MLVVINTKELSDKNLCPNNFIFLSLLYRKYYATCEQFYLRFNVDFDILIDRGYLLSKESVDAFIAGSTSLEELPINVQKLNELMGLKDSYFWEIFSVYPIKVPAGKGMQGYRILKAGSVDAKQTLVLKKKYDNIVGPKNQVKHTHIMRCLKAELWYRKKEGSMPYMKRLETWLNQHSWEEYEPLLELSTERKIKQDSYGEKLI